MPAPSSAAATSLASRPSTLLLIVIVSLSPLTMHIYLPSMPGMATDLQTSDALVQLTLSVYLFAVAAAQLIIGPLSDRFGRRPTLLAGLVLFLVATAFCRFATSVEALIVARAFQAIGGCAGMVIGRAIVRDISTRNGAASLLGYVTMGMAIAQMMGPAIGGFLDGLYGWRASFDLLLLAGAGVLVCVFLLLRETNTNPQTSLSPRHLVRSHGQLLAEPRYWAFVLTSAFASGVFFAFLGGGPVISQRQMGLSPVEYGFYFTLIAVGYAIGNYVSGRYSERVGTASMIMIGNIIGLAAVIFMVVLFAMGLVHPTSLFVPMFVSSFSNGIALPNALSGAMSVRPDLAGTASGVAGSVQLTFGALATVLVGWLLYLGIWSLITIMAIMATLALMAGFLANRMERKASLSASKPG